MPHRTVPCPACRHTSLAEIVVCRAATDCYSQAWCDGRGPLCPPSALRPDGTPCHGGVRACGKGACRESLCVGAGLGDCFCRHDPSDRCKLCCRHRLQESECLPATSFNITAPGSPGEDIYLPEGDGCLDYRGICAAATAASSGGGGGVGVGVGVARTRLCETVDKVDGDFSALIGLSAGGGGAGSGRAAWLRDAWFYFLLIPLVPALAAAAVLGGPRACGAGRFQGRVGREADSARTPARTRTPAQTPAQAQAHHARLLGLLAAAKTRSETFRLQSGKASAACDRVCTRLEEHERRLQRHQPERRDDLWRQPSALTQRRLGHADAAARGSGSGRGRASGDSPRGYSDLSEKVGGSPPAKSGSPTRRKSGGRSSPPPPPRRRRLTAGDFQGASAPRGLSSSDNSESSLPRYGFGPPRGDPSPPPPPPPPPGVPGHGTGCGHEAADGGQSDQDLCRRWTQARVGGRSSGRRTRVSRSKSDLGRSSPRPPAPPRGPRSAGPARRAAGYSSTRAAAGTPPRGQEARWPGSLSTDDPRRFRRQPPDSRYDRGTPPRLDVASFRGGVGRWCPEPTSASSSSSASESRLTRDRTHVRRAAAESLSSLPLSTSFLPPSSPLLPPSSPLSPSSPLPPSSSVPPSSSPSALCVHCSGPRGGGEGARRARDRAGRR